MAESAAVAIVGATGLVGRQIVETLGERGFPLSSLQLYASPRTAGEEIQCGGIAARVDLLDTARFAGTDIVIMAAGEQISAEWCGRAGENGALVIDTSQLFVGDADVPLIVPEVNAAVLAEAGTRALVTSPDAICVAAGVTLHPLYAAAGLRRVVITTFEPVSGAGRAGVDELQEQTLSLMRGESSEAKVFPHRVAFNVIPQLGEILAGGATKEEAATATALRRLLDAGDLPIGITRVRVPTFYGAALSLNVQTEQPLAADDVRDVLRPAPGLVLMEELDAQGYPTPADTVGEDATYVGRLRCDADNAVIDMWVAADNLRKGSVINAVQIAELWLRDYL